jgi:hypothetical protein
VDVKARRQRFIRLGQFVRNGGAGNRRRRFHEFVRAALVPWADQDDPGMHRTATIDYDVVLEGTIGLELDDGTEVVLGPGTTVARLSHAYWP